MSDKLNSKIPSDNPKKYITKDGNKFRATKATQAAIDNMNLTNIQSYKKLPPVEVPKRPISKPKNRPPLTEEIFEDPPKPKETEFSPEETLNTNTTMSQLKQLKNFVLASGTNLMNSFTKSKPTDLNNIKVDDASDEDDSPSILFPPTQITQITQLPTPFPSTTNSGVNNDTQKKNIQGNKDAKIARGVQNDPIDEIIAEEKLHNKKLELAEKRLSDVASGIPEDSDDESADESPNEAKEREKRELIAQLTNDDAFSEDSPIVQQKLEVTKKLAVAKKDLLENNPVKAAGTLEKRELTQKEKLNAAKKSLLANNLLKEAEKQEKAHLRKKKEREIQIEEENARKQERRFAFESTIQQMQKVINCTHSDPGKICHACQIRANNKLLF